MWPVGIRRASVPSRRRARACSSATKCSNPRTVICMWLTRRVNCSSGVNVVLVIEPSHCNRTSAVCNLKKPFSLQWLSIVARLLRPLSEFYSEPWSSRKCDTHPSGNPQRRPCTARLQSCDDAAAPDKWSAGHGPRHGANNYSIFKDPRRGKQLIRKELRALTVRLWDWVRFARQGWPARLVAANDRSDEKRGPTSVYRTGKNGLAVFGLLSWR